MIVISKIKTVIERINKAYKIVLKKSMHSKINKLNSINYL